MKKKKRQSKKSMLLFLSAVMAAAPVIVSVPSEVSAIPMGDSKSFTVVKGSTLEMNLKDNLDIWYSSEFTIRGNITDNPTNGTLSISDNQVLVYTPETDYIGSDSFTIEIDERGMKKTITVNIEVVPPFSGVGDGTEVNPYVVTSADQLNEVRYFLSSSFKLANNIDLANYDAGDGMGWLPIGGNRNEFKGIFDGAGFKIKNLTINRANQDSVGLFGYVNANGTIKNLSVEAVNVTGDSFTGGIAGSSYGTIENCYTTGIVKGNDRVGGLIGSSGKSIKFSYSTVHVTGTEYVGGLVGLTSNGVVEQSYATGNVTASGINAGGLVGRSGGSTITKSYATGEVSGADNIGGLVGFLEYYGAKVVESYATGKLSATGTPSNIGGLVGYKQLPENSINGYYDQDKTSQSDTGKGTPKTTAEMMQQTTYDGWDFTDIWEINGENSYPTLKNINLNLDLVPDPDKFPTASPTLTGTAKVGETFTANSGYADADGDVESGTTYAFYSYDADGTNETVVQAVSTTNTYTIQAADAGKVIKVKVVPKNANGAGVGAVSGATAVIAVAVYETTDNNDGTVTITNYNGTATDVVIPREIDGKTVTAIGDYAFKEKGLTSVLIPENVTVIGSQAFISNKLKYVVIPANVETIGSYAFYENRIEHITFNGIPNLGQSPFGNQGFPLYTDEGLQTMWDGISVPDGGKVYAKRIPDAPTDVTAVAGLEEATVSFKGPTHSGGNAVIGYTVKVFIDGEEQTDLEQTGNASPIKITGLTNGKAYTFKVVATNAAGNSVESEASAAVTPSDQLPTAAPTLTGTAKVGETLTANSGYADADGDVESGTTYAFYSYDADGTNETVVQAVSTTNTYTIQAADAGKVIKVKVVPKNANGAGVGAVSGATAVIAAPTSPPTPGPTPEPTPQPDPEPQQKVEEITIPVEIGDGKTGTTAKIKRTTEADGTKKDEVSLSEDKAKETVKQLKESGGNTARIVIPDAKDEVSEVKIVVPQAATNELRESNVNLELSSDNVKISIPTTSFNEINEDLYFRVVPIKKEQERKELENRARVEIVVQDLANDQNVNVIARPMTIETNMQNRLVNLVLPLKDVELPTDEAERAAFLANLAIFIEHSDGEKKLVKGTVVEYENGQLGLAFSVNKFSTFTILHMEGGWKEPNYNTQFTGRTTELELPVLMDKVWTITFNQAANPETVNRDTVYVYDENGEKVAVDIQPTNYNRSIKINPKTYYKPNTTYYLYLSENLESVNGKQLGVPERYVFKTTSHSLETGKHTEKIDVSPTKEWTVTFNMTINKASVTNNNFYVTDQHGRKVAVVLELINPKTVQIKPVQPYSDGQTYYLFMKEIASDTNMVLKDQTWMKFTIKSKME